MIESDRGPGTGRLAPAVAIQPDGRIIAVGEAFDGHSSEFALARLNSNGTLDDAFGTGGIVTTRMPASSHSAVTLALRQ